MPGEFRGDFTRDTANPAKSFLRVLMQGGRAQVEADWNEQIDILLRHIQGLGQDLIGFHGGRGEGFEIQSINSNPDDFAIAPGRYYVDGIPCEQQAMLDPNGNLQPWTYTTQPYYTIPETETLDYLNQQNPNDSLLAYLDVWERHITFVEDYDPNTPGIREVALGGPDTATRSQVVWQVKVIPAESIDEFLEGFEGRRNAIFEATPPSRELNVRIRYLTRESFRAYLQASGVELKPGTGRLRARVDNQKDETDPCRLSPKSKYRGLENRLYRVEILSHTAEAATFAWSRYNSSVMFPILQADTGGETVTVSLEHLGQDARYSLTEGDSVELVSDRWVLNNEPRFLLQVEAIDTYERSVVLKKPEGTPEFVLDSFNDPEEHPYLRRWYSPGTVAVSFSPEVSDGWLALEDGIEVQFPDFSTASQPYKTGDYWLIPARTVTGDIEWPQDAATETPKALPPRGITHYYAPLAIVRVFANDNTVGAQDCRRQLQRLWIDPGSP
ncbi:MAG: hypothetical protein F6K42_29435 [Leptolyngbya sp. SIO1D8]|nr:hypothetical protein [Leptolyngbya sp. SIO1D8]